MTPKCNGNSNHSESSWTKIEEESVMEQTLTTKEKEPSQEGHKLSERMGLKSIMQDQKRRKECS